MTFDERLRELSYYFDDPEPVITAIKQAMRETMPERANNNRYFESPPPAKVDDGSELHHVMHQPSARDGYNTAIDEIEKGFGL